MASESLQDLLGYVTLTGLIQTNVPTLPRVLPAAFYSGTPIKVEGDAGRYTLTTANRTTAKLNRHRAPARPRDLIGVGQRDVKLLSASEFIEMPTIILEALRNPTNYDMQDRGRWEVLRQVKQAKQYPENLRNIAALRAIVKGVIYADVDGNIQSTSSNADTTVDFKIPAAQQNVTISDYLASQTTYGTFPTGNWNVTSTDIMGQLLSMVQIAQAQHGYVPMNILYGRNIPGYLATNDTTQYFAARQAGGFAASYLGTADLKPDMEFGGFKWFNGMNGFQNDQNGTYMKIVGDDDIIFFPDYDESWWEWQEGTNDVPTSLQPVQGDLAAAMANYKKVYGTWAYSIVQHNPVRMDFFYGDTFLPIIKNPQVVYQLRAK